MEGFASANAFPQTPAAPPPPPEVKVRTMRSDLESMTKSGGAAPHFENVRMNNLPSAVAPAPALGPSPAPSSHLSLPSIPGMDAMPGESKMWVIALVVLAGLAGLSLVGYLIYKIFVH